MKKRNYTLVAFVNKKFPKTFFELSSSGIDVVFTIRRVASHPFQASGTHSMHFPSVAILRSQLQRISNRIKEPQRALSAVPWSCCWPPYRDLKRQTSFFVGSLSSFYHGRRQHYFSFALATHLGEPVVWCVGRGLSESVFEIPPSFFDSVIMALRRG